MIKHFHYYWMLFLMVSACEMNEIPEMEDKVATDDPVILDASSEEKNMFANWISNGDPNGRRSMNYDPAKLVKVANSTHERLAVISDRDPNTSLSFVVNPVTNKID